MRRINKIILQKEIRHFVAENEGNKILGLEGARFFDEPLIGFADASDPIFTEYTRIIGGFHLTPFEWLGKTFPKEVFSGGSVICWILPITEETRASNRVEIRYPSKRWALTKECGERFNRSLRNHVAKLFGDGGFKAVAPANSEFFKILSDRKVGRASNWSERHTAYAAGLGTFSLNDGFITEKGVAMRCGSVITNLTLKPTKRKYENHLENCLFYNEGGACGICIKRCPVKAITKEKGHDKVKCRRYVNKTIAKFTEENYGVAVSCCGLCQTNVPCESKIP